MQPAKTAETHNDTENAHEARHTRASRWNAKGGEAQHQFAAKPNPAAMWCRKSVLVLDQRDRLQRARVRLHGKQRKLILHSTRGGAQTRGTPHMTHTHQNVSLHSKSLQTAQLGPRTEPKPSSVRTRDQTEAHSRTLLSPSAVSAGAFLPSPLVSSLPLQTINDRMRQNHQYRFWAFGTMCSTGYHNMQER